MASNKKPKKKYTPRTVYFPKMIIAMHSIEPIEKALNDLLEKSILNEDSAGNYVYYTGDGALESFEAGLDIYNFVVQEICNKRGIDWKPTALLELRETFVRKDVFDEDNILEAKICLENCKRVISSVHPTELREAVNKVRLHRKNMKKRRDQVDQ